MQNVQNSQEDFSLSDEDNLPSEEFGQSKSIIPNELCFIKPGHLEEKMRMIQTPQFEIQEKQVYSKSAEKSVKRKQVQKCSVSVQTNSSYIQEQKEKKEHKLKIEQEKKQQSYQSRKMTSKEIKHQKQKPFIQAINYAKMNQFQYDHVLLQQAENTPKMAIKSPPVHPKQLEFQSLNKQKENENQANLLTQDNKQFDISNIAQEDQKKALTIKTNTSQKIITTPSSAQKLGAELNNQQKNESHVSEEKHRPRSQLSQKTNYFFQKIESKLDSSNTSGSENGQTNVSQFQVNLSRNIYNFKQMGFLSLQQRHRHKFRKGSDQSSSTILKMNKIQESGKQIIFRRNTQGKFEQRLTNELINQQPKAFPIKQQITYRRNHN